jgi:Glycosyltransferase family 87
VRLDDHRSTVFVNAHPPTSVLLAVPFARIDFDHAFLAWNLGSLAALAASLVIVQRTLKVPFSAWSLARLSAMLLLCFPLWEQCRLGQLTLVLLLLITGAWAAERSGRPRLAAVLLGAATSIKLFPGFLFVYYALRGRRRVVAVGLVTIVGLSALTAAVLGVDVYRSYFLTVLPEIQWFRAGWNNNSFWGFWSRLFDPAPEHQRERFLTEPLYYRPMLSAGLSLASAATVTGLLAWIVRRGTKGSPQNESADPLTQPSADLFPHGEVIEPASSGVAPTSLSEARKNDLTFAMAVTAMLLVSPICWEHYLLLLLAPLAIVWVELPASRSARAAPLTIMAAFWVGYPVTWTAFDLNVRTATPIDSIGILSYQFYALLGFLALTYVELMRRDGRDISSATATRRSLALGAVVMFALWVPVLHAIWRDYGLFVIIGGDFGIYRSIAEATLALGPRAMYDLDAVEPYARELMVYYGPHADGLNLGPGPYPAVYILPFLLLNLVSPPVGYLVW